MLILFNGVLAMSELAIVSAREVRLQQAAEDGSHGAAVALDLQAEPNKFLSTVQIGITLVGILAGAFGGSQLSGNVSGWLANIDFIAPYADTVAFVLVVSTITYLTLVIGELVPKRLALQHAETLSILIAQPMKWLSIIASPLVWILGESTDLVLRLARVQQSDEPSVTEEEVRSLLQQGAQIGVFNTAEHEMVVEVFRLSDRTVKEIMTPRTRMTWLDINAPIEELSGIVAESDYRSYPVARGNPEVVVGVIRSRDFWRHTAEDGDSLSDIIHEAMFVPETLPAIELLEDFRQSGEELAIVLDEFGGVDGIVTLQDIVDEIAGEFARPDEQPNMVQREDGSWLVDGLVAIHDINEILGEKVQVDGQERDFETIAGFVIDELGRIPSTGDIVKWHGWQFEIVDMDRNRVDQILISPLASSDSDASQPPTARS